MEIAKDSFIVSCFTEAVSKFNFKITFILVTINKQCSGESKINWLFWTNFFILIMTKYFIHVGRALNWGIKGIGKFPQTQIYFKL